MRDIYFAGTVIVVALLIGAATLRHLFFGF